MGGWVDGRTDRQTEEGEVASPFGEFLPSALFLKGPVTVDDNFQLSLSATMHGQRLVQRTGPRAARRGRGRKEEYRDHFQRVWKGEYPVAR